MNRNLLFFNLLLVFNCGSQTPYIEGDRAVCINKWFALVLHGDSTHSWANADNPTYIISNDSILNGQAAESTTFLCFTSTDTLEHHIEVFDNGCDCLFFVPNHFTPDGDPFNEKFFPVFNCGHIGAHMTIYSRNQKVVYDSSELYPVWDGTHYETSEQLPDGMYIWQISYMKEDGKIIRELGWVFLLR